MRPNAYIFNGFAKFDDMAAFNTWRSTCNIPSLPEIAIRPHVHPSSNYPVDSNGIPYGTATEGTKNVLVVIDNIYPDGECIDILITKDQAISEGYFS